tara:strand:+ start:3936 stop:4103 length:168 start_codon:yes stop_codon:yes gene_type:complete
MFDFAFKSAKEALYMEGHGIYVWSVVIVVSFCLIYAFIHYKIKLKKFKKRFNEPY